MRLCVLDLGESNDGSTREYSSSSRECSSVAVQGSCLMACTQCCWGIAPVSCPTMLNCRQCFRSSIKELQAESFRPHSSECRPSTEVICYGTGRRPATTGRTSRPPKLLFTVKRMQLPDNQKAIWLIDCWPVHIGAKFRQHMRENYPNILILFVPPNCTEQAASTGCCMAEAF